MTAYEGAEHRWDGKEKRASPPELQQILAAVEETRKAYKSLAYDVSCLKKSIAPFEPMLQDMLDTRGRMRNVRWTMLAVLGASFVTGSLSFLWFVGWLIFEWGKANIGAR